MVDNQTKCFLQTMINGRDVSDIQMQNANARLADQLQLSIIRKAITRYYDNKCERLAPESFSKVFESLRVHGASHVNQIQTLTTDTRRTPRAQFGTFNRLLLKLASTKADLAPAQKIRECVVDRRLMASCIFSIGTDPSRQQSLHSNRYSERQSSYKAQAKIVMKLIVPRISRKVKVTDKKK